MLVNALLHLEDDAYWKNLTGNPGQLAVLILLHRNTPKGLEFGARQLQYTKSTITEAPEFIFEKLDDAEVAVQHHSAKAVAAYPENLFAAGWSQGDQVMLRVPSPELTPGKWRVILRGTIKGRAWHSEPLEMTWPIK